ncbi:MAG: hypothetical protein M0R38_04080 [Bacteroidia bacterium]|nr:hypothetical protein [Bacteroidia bacterium]
MEKLHTNLILLLKIIFACLILTVCVVPFLPNGRFTIFINQDLIKLVYIPWSVLPVVMLFSVLNFLLEALKWKKVGAVVEQFSFITAIKGVFAGIAFSNIFPWKTGEFIGKIAWLKEENRAKGAYLSVYSSMTQLFVTIVLGLLGLYFFSVNGINEIEKNRISLISMGLLLFLLLFLFVFRNRVLQMTGKVLGKRVGEYFQSMKSIPFTLTIQLLVLSFLRYVTFCAPYLILFKIFVPELSVFIAVTGVSLVFLLQSIVPGFLLSDLPVKGFIHIAIFSTVIAEAWIVGNAVLLVFIINQIIPSVIGAWILLAKRFRNV